MIVCDDVLDWQGMRTVMMLAGMAPPVLVTSLASRGLFSFFLDGGGQDSTSCISDVIEAITVTVLELDQAIHHINTFCPQKPVSIGSRAKRHLLGARKIYC